MGALETTGLPNLLRTNFFTFTFQISDVIKAKKDKLTYFASLRRDETLDLLPKSITFPQSPSKAFLRYAAAAAVTLIHLREKEDNIGRGRRSIFMSNCKEVVHQSPVGLS